MHWSADYLGLTWQEVGPELCWGLVRKVLFERAGIVVPSYEPMHRGCEQDAETIAALLKGESSTWPWREVTLGHEHELDVAVFSRGGIESHVGVVVGDRKMLHLARDYDARIEHFDQGRWKTRLAGLYRHAYLHRPS